MFVPLLQSDVPLVLKEHHFATKAWLRADSLFIGLMSH